MNRFLIGLSYLLVLNFELALFMMGGVYGGRYLNSKVPQSFNWVMITTPLSVLLCCFAIYRYLVVIVKSERKKASDD
jgi:uncharacterized membrane protein